MSKLLLPALGVFIGSATITIVLIISSLLSVGMAVVAGAFGFTIFMIVIIFLEFWLDRKYPL